MPTAITSLVLDIIGAKKISSRVELKEKNQGRLEWKVLTLYFKNKVTKIQIEKQIESMTCWLHFFVQNFYFRFVKIQILKV
jgi:hypothetical protein